MTLHITDLSVSYGRRPALAGATLPPIEGGSVVALLGANAAGKSTLLKALCGLVPARGRVQLGDLDLLELSRSERQSLLAYMPQAPLRASSLLVYEFVLSSLKAAGLAPSDLDHRIETELGRFELAEHALRPLAELSGGKRQLVAAALSLIRRPDLLLLDEPTSALDLRWQIEVLEAVRDGARQSGGVVLLALHEINLALRYADQVVVLHHGRVLAAGSPEVLSADVLRQAYGVTARVERLSNGMPVVVAEREETL